MEQRALTTMTDNPYAARKPATNPSTLTWRDRLWLLLVVFDTGALALRGVLCGLALVVFPHLTGAIWPLLQLPLVAAGLAGNVRLLRGRDGLRAVAVAAAGLILITAALALRYQPPPSAQDRMQREYMEQASRRDTTDAAAAAYRRNFESRRSAELRNAWILIGASVAYNFVYVYCAFRRRKVRT